MACHHYVSTRTIIWALLFVAIVTAAPVQDRQSNLKSHVVESNVDSANVLEDSKATSKLENVSCEQTRYNESNCTAPSRQTRGEFPICSTKKVQWNKVCIFMCPNRIICYRCAVP